MTGTYEECAAYVEKWRKLCPHMRYRIDIVVFERDGNHLYVVHSEPW